MLAYKKVGITVKSGLSRRDEAVRMLIDSLEKAGAEVLLDRRRCNDMEEAANHELFDIEKGLDLLIVVGGDGTILRAVRELADPSIPILSVNLGMLGFLAEMMITDIPESLPKFLRGEGTIDERALLDVDAFRDGKKIHSGCVLNEAVLSQGSIARLVDLRTSINGEELTIYRADGLIIATPTGSSAYSLAAGGPVVHPKMSATILTPINPQSFSQKPIVIPGDHEVEVEILTKPNKFHTIEVSLTLDGQTHLSLQGHDIIRTKRSARTVKFLRLKTDGFYATLRNKLKWGDRLD
ncbi:MAG: kinase [Candidatus Peribacteria bacterium]|nr:kinase [Candidatus Peribacteria bacterium]